MKTLKIMIEVPLSDRPVFRDLKFLDFDWDSKEVDEWNVFSTTSTITLDDVWKYWNSWVVNPHRLKALE
jgi:hypothetical protein